MKRLVLLFTLLTASWLYASETAFWQLDTFDDFLRGNLSGVSLSKEGELRLAPLAKPVFSPDETVALSLASDPQGHLYVGTGHQGKVFRLDRDLKHTLLFQAPEPEVLALAFGPDGALYVGTSPQGKVYRVEASGKWRVFFDPKAKYIWALAFDREDQLYVGTGDRGQIFRVDRSGKGTVFFDSTQTHIMCLTFDRSGNLLAGSEPNGLIYRIDPHGKAFVIYQSSLPEIHSLAVDNQGRIYAAALGNAGGRGSAETFSAPQPTAPIEGGVTTVTVVASTGSNSSELGQQPQQEKSAPPASRNRATMGTPGLPFSTGPQGKGSLIEILPDSSAETLWSSNQESIFGLAVRGHDVLFSTDAEGRIFSLSPSAAGSDGSPKLTLLTETPESLPTRLLLHGSDLYIATSNIARLFRVGSGLATEGTYESPVKDTKFISHWGTIAWRADTPPGCTLQFYSRSGNSERPDNTWSDWAGPYTNPEGSTIQSPPARFLQWKAVFRGPGSASPTLDQVRISYLNQNLPPVIHALSVTSGGERSEATGAAFTPSSGGASVVVTTSPTTFGNPPASASAHPKDPVVITWQAEDPNGDQLVYSLYLRGEGEREWHLLKRRLRETSYTIDPDALADGRYLVRLVASDEESNSPQTARQTELVSAPFWVDNTPPRVRVVRQSVLANGADVSFEAESNLSPLRKAEVSIDGGEWHSVNSDDGVVDSRRETFTLRNLPLASGEHLILLRVWNTTGNAGLGKAVVRVAGQ